MSRGPGHWGAGLRGLTAGAADCRGRDCCAGAGWAGERGSWEGEGEARGNGRRIGGAGALAPDGRRMTWPPSGGGD